MESGFSKSGSNRSSAYQAKINWLTIVTVRTKRNNVVRSPFRKCSLFLKCSITLAGWGHGLLMGARIDVVGETCDANFPPGGRVAFPGKNWRNAATRRARKGWRPPDRRRLHYHLLDRPLDPSTPRPLHSCVAPACGKRLRDGNVPKFSAGKFIPVIHRERCERGSCMWAFLPVCMMMWVTSEVTLETTRAPSRLANFLTSSYGKRREWLAYPATASAK